MLKRIAAAILFSSLFLASTETIFAQNDHTAPAEMTEANFADPPNSVRPWVYYWQLKGNTTKELVTRDLENMKEIGVGGLLVFDSRRYWDDYDSKTHVPVPLEIKNEFMSEGWVDVMSWLVSEAARLGLQVSFNISDSGGQLRGPWDMKDLGPYELIWTEENVNGAKSITLNFSIPEDKPYYSDFAALAVRITTPVSEGREAVKLNNTWGQVVYDSKEPPQYDQIVDLTEKIVDGKLQWDVPEGHWKILRFGTTRIGEPGCVDILNAKSVEDYYHKMPGALLKACGENAGKTLSHFYNVSWEGVHPNWTSGFAAYFAAKRGYDIREYLPILRGLAPQNIVRERFVADYVKTISDSFRENCYETIGRLCHDDGVYWHSEDGGPWNRNSPLFREADMLTFWGQNDFPQGEFWINSPNQTNAVFAAMAAHIYGRRDVSLEAFTHMIQHWSVYPAMLKPFADRAYLAGANFMIWHTYTASPIELGKPGFEYFAGTHVNSNVTWQKYVKPFMDYMARCQQMLRQGVHRADICVYMSDKNYTAWGHGETWNKDSKLKCPAGYKYDLLDTKVLVERLTYEDGVFKLPGGAEYRLLVLDPNSEEIPLAAMRKIVKLAEQGAPILLGNTKPTRSTGLTDWQNADQEVKTLADKLWNSQQTNVIHNRNVFNAMYDLRVWPDFETRAGFQFDRRKTDDADIYYVAAPGQEAQSGYCAFRVSGKKVSFWNPIDGTVAQVDAIPTDDGRTLLHLDLEKEQAVFVVFSEKEYSQTYEKTAREKVLAIDGSWKVSFDPTYGGPEEAVFDKLSYWDQNADEGIKYYSGTAVYKTTFELAEPQLQDRLTISLGKVCDIARVKLNGQDLGIAWIDPWELELKDAAKAGVNELEIEVANCWKNRLIGDAGLEPEKRYTKTNVVLEKERPEKPMPRYRGYYADDALEPSGLIGPVEILRVTKQR